MCALTHTLTHRKPRTQNHMPRPAKSIFLHSTKVKTWHPGASYITACLSHIPPILSRVAEYRRPLERGTDIELAGRLRGGVTAAENTQ